MVFMVIIVIMVIMVVMVIMVIMVISILICKSQISEVFRHLHWPESHQESLHL